MPEQETFVDEAEVDHLSTRWGSPIRHHVSLTVEPAFWLPWGNKWHERRGEVLFLLPRPGGLLLHRKSFYPRGGWRLLTGGIEWGESVAETVPRELAEEVGLELPIRRYVALLTYEIRCENERHPWATHIFLLPYSERPLQPSHDGEIAETRVTPLDKLPRVADRLAQLRRPWRDWGRFRAIAHRVVADQLAPGEIS